MIKAKSYRTLVVSAKLLIFGLAVLYIWYRLTAKGNDFQWEEWLAGLSSADTVLLIGIILLMPLNWGIEALKWRLMVKVAEPVSVKTAFKATLTGTTISLLTPNRVGGFLGRIIFLKPENRLKASWISILGNVSQLMATLLLGTIALLWLPPDAYKLPDWLKWVALGAMLLMVLFYWRAGWWSHRLSRWKALKKLSESADVLGSIPMATLNKAFLLSLARYLVFALQFYLVLRICNLQATTELLFGLIAVTYLAVAIIPSFMLGNLGIRESQVIFFFAGLGAGTDVLLAGSLLIWIINLVLPAIAGGIILQVTKIKIKDALK